MIFLLKLGLAVVSIKALGWASADLEEHYGRKYQGSWGADFLLKPRFAIVTMNGVELENHFCAC